MDEVLYKLINSKDVKSIVKIWLNIDLTPTQCVIVRKIAYSENKRMVISCLTRYGKSYCVAIGVLLFIAFNQNKKVLIISPQESQSKIIRDYLANFIVDTPLFADMVDLEATGIDRLRNEVSKKKITFRNGCIVMILSAEGTGDRLMGEGSGGKFGEGGLIILDESCLIKYDVYRSKISRMLGDSPDTMLVEIGNPWNRDNQMYDHWLDPKFEKIHVNWELALKEGRISQEFLDEQKKDLTSIEFDVLYNAVFPEQSEDSLFIYRYIEEAIYKNLPKIKKQDRERANRIISCDVAGKGLDKTVIMWGFELDGKYYIEDMYWESRSENMQIASKIIQIFRKHKADVINIDTIGIGEGVISRVREVLGNDCKVVACHFGEAVGTTGKETKPTKGEKLQDRKSDSGRKRFRNRKAEQYMRLSELFEGGMIAIPEHRQLLKELSLMRYDYTSGEKIQIVDPENKSPDFADALVYFIWKVQSGVYISF